MIEEALLCRQCVGPVIGFPLLAAVGVPPLFGRADTREGLEGTPCVQAMVRPARADQRWRVDALERRLFASPVPILERMLFDLVEEIFSEIEPPIAPANHAVLPPGGDEAGFGNAAMERKFAIEIADRFPWDDRFEVWWPQCRDAPLRHGEVGDA